MMSPARLRLIALLAALAAALQSGCGGKSSAPGAVAPSAFSYAASPATYTKGVAISPSLPHSSGGAAASYTISPQLPAGLTFDATSGVIAGTPTVLSPLTAYTVTAINAGGTASCSLLIAVNDVAPAALSYSHNAVTYTRGVATSLVLATAERYDPAANTWIPLAGMSSQRFSHAATLLPDGRVLVTGGRVTSFQANGAADLYDPATQITSAMPLAAARAYHTATLLDAAGTVLILGGSPGSTPEYWKP